MIVFDTSGILHLLDPGLPPTTDPKTGKPVTDTLKRIEFYVSELHRQKEKILIPAPVLGELLILSSPDGPSLYSKLKKSAAFKIEPFDDRAAIELAIMTSAAMKAGDKKAGSTASMAKVKFDRQIIATARVHRAKSIFSDDENVGKFAQMHSITVISIWDLPLPPKDAQPKLWEHLVDEA